MTIDEASRRLISLRKVLTEGTDQVFLDALQLGIEALKSLRRDREQGNVYRIPLLPGETKE